VTEATPGTRILVVEDDPQLRELCCEILEQRGHEALAVGSAAEALLLAEVHANTIDLVVMDIELPDLSGPELVRRLGAFQDHCEVLYITGHGDQPEALHGVPAGYRILSKPFSPRQLLQEVDRLLSAADG
jgi:two-component system cell cycle sensor histidine kinase/response regulator CckA